MAKLQKNTDKDGGKCRSMHGVAAFALEFIGGLVYLDLLRGLNGFFALVAWNYGAGSLWLPVLIGLAAVSAIGLIISSFANLKCRCMECSCNGMGKEGSCGCSGNGRKIKPALMFAVAGGISLSALTFGSAMYAAALVGFLLAVAGAIASKKG